MTTSEHATRLVRRGRRFGRISILQFWLWLFLFATIFLLYFLFFGLKLLSPGMCAPFHQPYTCPYYYTRYTPFSLLIAATIEESPNISVKEQSSPSDGGSKHRKKCKCLYLRANLQLNDDDTTYLMFKSFFRFSLPSWVKRIS